MEKNGPVGAHGSPCDRQEKPHSIANPAPGLAALGRIRIVLCEPRHPGNVGATARAMKTMGLSRLCLVRPERMAAGLVDAEAEARASGAGDVIAAAHFCDSLDEALAGVAVAAAVTARRRELGPARLSAREAAQHLVAAAAHSDVALVFGNETAGLDNARVLRCQHCVEIPADPAFTSLNLAAAVQVLAYELRQAALAGAGPAAAPVFDPATHDAVEGLFAQLERSMVVTGFLDPQQPRRLLPKMRRLFGRAGLQRDEVNILRGFLAAVETTCGHGRREKK